MLQIICFTCPHGIPGLSVTGRLQGCSALFSLYLIDPVLLAVRACRLTESVKRSLIACSTTTLALGSRQLAQQGAIVTRLTAIEEMAGMTLLCSDKTGTLTLNTMVIQVIKTSCCT